MSHMNCQQPQGHPDRCGCTASDRLRRSAQNEQTLIALKDLLRATQQERDAAAQAAGNTAAANHKLLIERDNLRAEVERLQRIIDSKPAAQEPVAWQFFQDGRWWNGYDNIPDHRANTEAAGIPTRDLYAAPQATPQPTADTLMRVIFGAQLKKPSDIMTGTSNWAGYMAAQVTARALLGKEDV